jgi:hypothetical protein
MGTDGHFTPLLSLGPLAEASELELELEAVKPKLAGVWPLSNGDQGPPIVWA